MPQGTLCHSSRYTIVIFALNDRRIGFPLIGNAIYLVTITQGKTIKQIQDLKLQ